MAHVLIIEDEILIALDLAEQLEGHGTFSFAFASSEERAIVAAKERKPDVITCDVTLAQGFGPRAVKAIHAALGPIPTIFVTGTPDDTLMEYQPCVILQKACRSSLAHPGVSDVQAGSLIGKRRVL